MQQEIVYLKSGNAGAFLKGCTHMFTLTRRSTLGRRGILKTPRGEMQTPLFLPVATGGAMKGLTLEDLLELGAQALLCNTYHLHLQPGEEVIEQAAGLHSFINWKKPILTDSGGFQVFSLRHRLTMSDHGVTFQNHLNGDPLFVGPEESITIQHRLGSDIIMAFDHCPPSTATRKEIEEAVERTLRWARICKDVHERLSKEKEHPPLLFGIVQGGLERDLRERCTEELIAMDFDGYAIGGLAVGESEEQMYSVLDTVCPLLPPKKPRYLMGVGVLAQLQTCIAKGVDMFDCVHPMRLARHGTILLSNGTTLRIINAAFRNDHSPLDPDSIAESSRVQKKSYLHHLLRSGERLGETIACTQNMAVTLGMLQKLRHAMDAERSV